jgi:uncharacterized damage-inducible protein DinB
MENSERRVLVDQLEASRDRLLELVDGLTAEQWRFRPAEGRWSIGECLEHVVVVENRVLGSIETKLETKIETKLGEGTVENRERVSEPATEKDAVVARIVPDRSVARQAPENAQPTGRWPDSAELLAEFRKTRQRTTDFAATTQGDLRSYFIPHGALGELDCYQWLLVLSLHGARHAQQIEEVKATAGFPRVN